MYILEGYCYGATCHKYGPIEITEHHTIKQIADSLKNDMGFDYDEWLTNQNLDRDFWVKHYNTWAEFWKNQEKEGLKNLAITIAPLMGQLPEEVDETIITQHDNTAQIKNVFTLRKICKWSYNGVMLFFVFAIVSVAIGFFCSVS